MASLQALNVLFTPTEERFDRITRCATRLLDVPISVVSLVASNVQWFKSTQGVDSVGSTRSVSFCGHAVLSDDQLVVTDATRDQRFHDNPLVTGEPFIRAYAGQPLHGADGQRVGSLCAIDRRPREFSRTDLEILRDLGRWVETELQTQALSESQQELVSEVESLRRLALIDRLTRAWNRGAIDDVLARELERGRRDESPVGVVLLDLDHFKQVNDTYGHPAGDEVLREVARRIRATVRPFDALGRYGGEEFLVVLSNCNEETSARIAERIADSLREQPVTVGKDEIVVTASLGVVAGTPVGGADESGNWIDRADQCLYRAKRAGRDRIELDHLERCAA